MKYSLTWFKGEIIDNEKYGCMIQVAFGAWSIAEGKD
jgi:hypothetical protein